MKGYEFPAYDTPVQKSKNVVVIGGGNVAMDAARSAKRLGAENVSIIYRRSREELPAREEEYHHSVEEGINYHWLTNPVEYINDGSGRLQAVKCVKMELGEPDESGRRRPQVIPGSEFVVEADTAIEAIGQGANRVLLDTFPELQLNRWGYIDAGSGNRRHLDSGSVCRRGYRDRCCHRHFGDGRRQSRGSADRQLYSGKTAGSSLIFRGT